MSTNNIIDGYVNKTSFENGETIEMFLNYLEEEKTTVKISDLNCKAIDTISCDVFPNNISNENPCENGAGYKLTCTYKLENYKSGIYLIDNKVSFLVKEKTRKTDFVVVYETNTVEVYNSFGGKNGYTSAPDQNDFWKTSLGKYKDRAKILNFHRPKCTTGSRNGDDVSIYCKSFLKWCLNSEFDIKYISDIDLENFENIKNTKNVVICGHNEYWSMKMKNNIDKFTDFGNNLTILSGNSLWWQIRYDYDKNQIIIYKEPHTDPIIETNPEIDTTLLDLAPLKYSCIESIGLSFRKGGIQNNSFKTNRRGYTIVNNKSILLKDINLKSNLLVAPFKEADGGDLIEINKNIYLLNKFNLYKYELIGYDANDDNLNINMSFVIMKRTKKSGTIINTGNMNWCSQDVFECVDSDNIKKITSNIFELLRDNYNVFSVNNVNSINIWRNIKDMYIESKKIQNFNINDIPIRGIPYMEILEHNDNKTKLKINEKCSSPGLFTRIINVNKNSSYCLCVTLETTPKYLHISIYMYDENKKIINDIQNQYVINDDNKYYYYFDTCNYDKIYISVGLKNPYKNSVISFSDFSIKEVDNSILFNIYKDIKIDFIPDKKCRHLLKNTIDKNIDTVYACIDISNFDNLKFPKNILRDIKGCEKKGYYCKEFVIQNFLDDFVDLRTSAKYRQGSELPVSYFKTVEQLGGYKNSFQENPINICEHHYKHVYGVFKKKEGHKQGNIVVNEQLLGYISLIRDGNIGCFSQIMGHADHLSFNIMVLLQYYIFKLESNNNLKYIFYAGWNDGNDNLKNEKLLQNMKERLLFKPCKFKIKNNFETDKNGYEKDDVITNNQNVIIKRNEEKLSLLFKQQSGTPGIIYKNRTIQSNYTLSIVQDIAHTSAKKIIIMIKDLNNNLLLKATQEIANYNKFEIKLDDSGVVDIYILYSGIQCDDVIIFDNLKI